MRFASILIATFLASTPAHAYPVFFTCNKDKSLGTVLTPPELAKQLEALQAAYKKDPQGAVEKACTDVNACVRDMGRLLELGKALQGTMQVEAAEKIKEIAAKAGADMESLRGFLKIPEKDMELFESAYRMGAETYECRQVQAALPVSSMAGNKDACMLGNFHHSPYMYVSGERFSSWLRQGKGESYASDSYSFNPAECGMIDEVIKSAIAAGQDPLATLAIGLMENATNVKYLHLDPVGIVASIGCSVKAIEEETDDSLFSFGSYYKVKFGVHTNPKLDLAVQNKMKQEGIQTMPGKSFYCFAEGYSEISNQASANGCCLKLPFSFKSLEDVQNKTTLLVEEALTYHSLEQYLRPALSKKIKSADPIEAPARRMQRFNGYTHLMGGAEAVSAWRSGVDMYNTPTYGYQAMDFILNSLMSNPYVMAKIKQAEEAVGATSPSVICEDLKPGSYAVDNMEYFRRHGKAPRMKTLVAKSHFTNLTDAQKDVMRNEWSELRDNLDSVQKALSLTDDEVLLLKQDSSKERIAEQFFQLYKSKIYPQRSTIADAIKMSLGYTWEEMTDPQFQNLLNAVKIDSTERKKSPSRE